jgi:hypothetical protein
MPFLGELSELDPDGVHIRPYDEHGFPTGAELLEYHHPEQPCIAAALRP